MEKTKFTLFLKKAIPKYGDFAKSKNEGLFSNNFAKQLILFIAILFLPTFIFADGPPVIDFNVDSDSKYENDTLKIHRCSNDGNFTLNNWAEFSSKLGITENVDYNGDGSGNFSITLDYPAPFIYNGDPNFTFGTITFAAIATNSEGLATTVNITMIVKDWVKPVFSALPDVSFTTDAGVCTAANKTVNITVVDIANSTPYNCSDPGNLTIEYYVNSGSYSSISNTTGTVSITETFSNNDEIYWKVTDEAGNFTETTQTVTVTDDEPPTLAEITETVTEKVDSNCGYDLPVTTTVSDNCDDNPTIKYNLNNTTFIDYISGTTIRLDGVGSHTVVWKAIDDADTPNESTATQTITLTDAIKPSISVNMKHDGTDISSYTESETTDTADVGFDDTYTFNFPTTGIFDYTKFEISLNFDAPDANEIEIYLENPNGDSYLIFEGSNEAAMETVFSSEYTYIWNTNGNNTYPNNDTISAGTFPLIGVGNTDPVSNFSNIDLSGDWVIAVSNVGGEPIAPIKNISIKYDGIDANVSGAREVFDAISTGENDCNADVMMEVTINDNCGFGSLSYVLNSDASQTVTIPADFSNPISVPLTDLGRGDNIIVWTLEDDANNVKTFEQKIIVEDKTSPVITNIEDATVYTDNASCNATGILLDPDISDNCSLGILSYLVKNPDGNEHISSTNVTGNPFTGETSKDNISFGISLTAGVGDYTIEWSLTDEAGNSLASATTQTITVEDNVNPTISVSIDNGTYPDLEAMPAGQDPDDPDHYEDGIDEILTLDLTGVEGNFDPDNFEISLNISSSGDDEAQGISVYLEDENGNEGIIFEGDINPDVDPDASFSDENTITWSNAASAVDFPSTSGVIPTGIYKISDFGTELTNSIELDGKWKIIIVGVDEFSIKEVSFKPSEDVEPKTLEVIEGENIFPTIYTDATSCNTDVAVNISDVLDNCEVDSLYFTLNGGTKTNLAIDITTHTFNDLPKGKNTIVWTVTDVNSNVTELTQIINVEDNVFPVIAGAIPSTIHTDASTNCSSTDKYSITATDNCEIESVTCAYDDVNDNWDAITPTDVTSSLSGSTYTTGDITFSGKGADHFVKWTVTDEAGNISDTIQIVTLIDNTDPIFTANVDTLGDDKYYICADGDLAKVEFSIDTTYFDDNCTLKDSIKVSYFYTKISNFVSDTIVSDTIVSDSSGYGLFSQDTLGVGEYVVTWILEDEAENTNTDTTSFSVEKIEVEDLALDFTDVSFIVGSEERFLKDNTGNVVDGDSDNTIHTWADGSTSPADSVMHLVSLDDACQAQNTAVYPITDNALTANLPVIIQKSALPSIVPIDLTCLSVKTNIQVPAYVFEVGRSEVIYYVVNDNLTETFPNNSMYNDTLNVWTEDIVDPTIINNNNDIQKTITDGSDCKTSVTWGEVSALDGNLCGATLKSYAKKVDTTFTGDDIILIENNNTWLEVNNGDEFEKGIWTIVYIATDESPEANKSGISFKLTVTDDVNPVISDVFNVNETVASTGDCKNTNTYNVKATDNCTGTITVEYATSDDFTTWTVATDNSNTTYTANITFGVGNHTIRWKATDEDDNESTIEEQTVTITDETAPVVVVVDVNETVDASCTLTQTFTATVTENCLNNIDRVEYSTSNNIGSWVPVADNANPTTLNVTFSGTGDNYIKWRAFDLSNNMSDIVTQNVKLTNNETPNITDVDDIPNQNTDNGVCTADVTIEPSITHNCTVADYILKYTVSGATTIAETTVADINNPSVTISLSIGTSTITWTLKDENDATLTSKTQNITVADQIAPEITANDEIVSATNACSHTGTFNVTVIDACSAIQTVEYNVGNGWTTVTETDIAGNIYTTNEETITSISIEWRATDEHNNISTITNQEITVEDNTPPVITAVNDITDGVFTDADCNASVTLEPDITDNCSLGSLSYVVKNEAGVTIASANVDTYNNSTEKTDISIANVNLNSGVGTYKIEWTLTDEAGNNLATNPTIQTITVTDNVDPTIANIGDQNITTVDCQASTSVEPTIDDNCEVASLSYTLDGGTSQNVNINSTNVNLENLSVGTHTIIWTVTDASENTNTEGTQTITVADETDPTISANNQTVQTITACTYTGKFTATANDNCSLDKVEYTTDGTTWVEATNTSGDTYTSNDITFDGVGEHTIQWKATDGGTNVSNTINQVITVEDETNPTITIADITTGVFTDGNCEAIATLIPVIEDNCSLGKLTYKVIAPSGATHIASTDVNTYNGQTSVNDISFDIDLTAGVGDYSVEWTLTDKAGNSLASTPKLQTITVGDNTDPIIANTSDLDFTNSPYTVCEANANFTFNGPTFYQSNVNDNCSGDITLKYVLYNESANEVNTVIANAGDDITFNETVAIANGYYVVWTATDANGNEETHQTSAFNVESTVTEVGFDLTQLGFAIESEVITLANDGFNGTHDWAPYDEDTDDLSTESPYPVTLESDNTIRLELIDANNCATQQISSYQNLQDILVTNTSCPIVITADKATPFYLGVGLHEITFEARSNDANGSIIKTKTLNIWVEDTYKPVINLEGATINASFENDFETPIQETIEEQAICEKEVAWTTPNITDNCGATGLTKVTQYKAAKYNGTNWDDVPEWNTETTIAEAFIEDGTTPDGWTSIEASGDPFPLGINYVRYVVRDHTPEQNINAELFKVIISKSTPPVFTDEINNLSDEQAVTACTKYLNLTIPEADNGCASDLLLTYYKVENENGNGETTDWVLVANADGNGNTTPYTFHYGLNTITWMVKYNPEHSLYEFLDASAKVEIEAIQTVEIIDTEAPVLLVNDATFITNDDDNGNINMDTDQCYATAQFSFTTDIISDNCDIVSLTYTIDGGDVITLTDANDFNNGGNFDIQLPYGEGTYIIAFTITDEHDNVETYETTLEVFDTQFPALSSFNTLTATELTVGNACQKEVTVTYPDVDENCTNTTTYAIPSVTDIYTISGITNDGSSVTFTVEFLDGVADVDINWTFTDNATALNSTPATQTLIFIDTTDPTITTSVENVNNTDDCTITYDLTPEIADNCKLGTLSYNIVRNSSEVKASTDIGNYNTKNEVTDISETITFNGVTFDADGTATYTVNWTLTDKENNQTTETQTVVVTDTEAPVITSSLTTVEYFTNDDNTPIDCSMETSFTEPTATDCTPAHVTVKEYKEASATEYVAFTYGQELEVGTYDLRYTFTDVQNNSSEKKFIIKVIDNTVPVVTNAEAMNTTVQIDKEATSYDDENYNCEISVTLSPELSDNCNLGVLAYQIFKNENSSWNEKPELANATVGFYDGFTTAIESDFTVNLGSYGAGEYRIVWILKDHPAENVANYTTTITVLDITKPIFNENTLVDVNIEINGEICEKTFNLQTPEFKDNCTGSSVTNISIVNIRPEYSGYTFDVSNLSITSQNTGTVTMPLGENTITWEISDENGNTETATQIVNLIDNRIPTITCNENLDLIADVGSCTKDIEIAIPAIWDNCPQTMELSVSFIDEKGLNGVSAGETFTYVYDNNGNLDPNSSNFNPETFIFPVNTSIDNATVLTWTLNDIITDGTHTVTCEQEVNVNASPVAPFVLETDFVNEMTQIGDIVSNIIFDENVSSENDINNYSLNIIQGFGDYTSFSINPLNDKILTSEATFNSENKSVYVIKMRAINCEDEDDAVIFDFFIYVNDENDAPQLEAYIFNIDENTQNSIEVGEIEAIDEDVTNQTLTYSIVNGNIDNAFALTPVVDNKTTIIVNNINALDFEINEYFNLEIEVSDGLISSTGSIVININDINEALTNAELIGATIQENIAIGANVLNATISVNDPDNSPEFTNYTYEITNGNIGNTFAINTNGELIINSDIDFETLDIYTLDIKVIDGLFNYTINDVVINIVNVNENPIVSNQSFSTNEDITLSATLANPVYVNDIDADDDLSNLTFVADLEGLTLNADGSFTYLNPNENFNGQITFTYKVIDDGDLESENATVSIIVNAINDAPVSLNNNYEIAEDETLISTTLTSETSILSNDDDVDNTNDELSLMLVNSTTNGNLTLNSDDGTFTYKADDDFNGEDSFTYLTYDGVAYSQMATVTITVIPMPDAPIAVNDNYSTSEEAGVSCDVLLNDTDIDNENNDNTNLTISNFTNGTNGFVNNVNNELVYTPSINFNGTDEFTYVVIDSDGLTSSATVTVVVNPVNDAPVVTALSFETNEDINLNELFEAEDIDNNFNDLTFEVIVSPTNGVLNLNENGSFTYAPNSNYYGDDYFTYLANDGELNSNVETVSITINPINDAPLANAQTFTIDEDNNLNETITSISDVDDNNDILEFEIISDNGFDIALNSDGSFIYTTVENFNGNVTFTYKVKDDGIEGAPAGLTELYSNDATITIVVNPVNDNPIAVDDNDVYTTAEETELISNISILNNDTDVDGDNLSTVLMSSTIHGILHLNTADGSFTYTPMTDFVGDDNFTYKVFDGTDYSEETGTVTITVTNTNDAPIANNDTYEIQEGEMLQSVDVNVMTNDIDIDSDNLTTSLINDVSEGSLLLYEDGSFNYVANPNFNGTDEFTYEITDGELTDQAVVTITSTPVNDIPQITYNLEFTTTEDSEILEGEITGVSDSDNDVLTFVLVDGITAEEGTLILNTTEGTFTYVPTENFNGNVNFTYKVYDGQEYSVEGNINITVNSVNDIPISNDQTFNFEEGQEVIGVITDVYDLEDNNLTFVLGNGANENLILEDNGSFTYNTDENFYGELTFTYKVKDSENTESEASNVTIIVTPLNDAPVIISQNFEMDEDGELNSTLLNSESITDIDNNITDLTFELVGNLEGLTLNSNDGSFTYNPEENFNGQITFTYKVNDGQLSSNEEIVTITVISVNDIPIANNDTYEIQEGEMLQSVDVNVMTNDIDIDSDNLTTSLINDVSEGSLLFYENGSFTYVPNLDWNGTDEFTYEITDGENSNQAIVTILVNPVNDVPQITYNLEFTTTEDAEILEGEITGVSDSDNDVLTFVLINGITAEEGTLILNTTEGTFSYVPTENFNGNVNFTYKVYDGQEYSVEGNINITVNSVNDIPISNDQTFNFEEGQEVIGVITDVYDLEDNNLTFVLGNGANENLILEDNGSFTYNTDENFYGELTFTYKVKDSENTESEASNVTIIVTPLNDAPVIISQNFEMDEDGELNSTLLNSESITDIDNNITDLTFELVGNLEGLTLNSNDGSFTYNPEENFNGQITFAYKVNDGQTLSNEANVLITVNPVNDAPIANNDIFEIDEEETLQMNVLENDLDIDGDNLIIVSNTNPANGTILPSDNSLIYVPNVNWNGTDEFTYEVSDGTTTSQATITVKVNPVNDIPEVYNQEFNTSEDIAQFYSIITEVNDDDNDELHFTIVNNIDASEGTLNLSDNGSFIYIPAQDFNGVVNFSYYVNDGIFNSNNVATITINVSAINDAPIANAQTFTTEEDIELSGTITNVLDIENDNLTFVQVGNLEGLTFNDDATFNYMPNENFNGEITFAYKVNDGEFDSEEATITIVVTPVNDNPVANDQEFNTDEDTPLTAVISNVSDVDNMNLSFELMSELEGLSLASSGLFNYIPIENSNETVTFVYQVSDGELLSEQKIVTININPINDEPVANDDIYEVLENEILNADISVLNNDTDVENSDLSVTLITPVSNGILALEADGTFTYTPNLDYFGIDNFTYEISDGELTNQASVKINVIAVNNLSVANADNYIMDENTQMVVSANDGVLFNDTDEDTDNVLTAVLSEDVDNGILILNDNGSFIYTPNSQYFGNDEFTYYVNDGTDNSNTTTVTITINEVNFVPIANNDTYNTYEDSSLDLVNENNGILSNDNDTDTDNILTAVMVDDSNLNGTIELNSNGSFIYTPNENFNGLATFTYQAYDAHDYSEIATVNITVTSVNDAPIAVTDDFTIDEDNALIVNFNGVLENDIDNDGNNLTAFLVSTVFDGDLMFNSDGSFTYVPNENFNGTDNFTYKAYDGTENSENVVVNINVNPVNDNPVAVDDIVYETNEGESLDITVALGVITNDTDIDSENLIAVLVNGTSNGNLILNNDGSFTYSPNENFNGEDYFTYNAQDNDGANSNVITVYINVINVNDPPVIENQTFDGTEDETLSDSLLNDEFITDIDNDINELTFELVTPIEGLILNSDDGSFTYLNTVENFNGIVSFTYKVFDGEDHSNIASVDINIAAVNDAPVAENQEFDAVEDIVINGNLANTFYVFEEDTIYYVSDVDSDNLTFELIDNDEADGLILELDGSFTYTPVADFNGNISFTYQVNDGELIDQANINIYVESVNDAPTFDNTFEFDVDENTANEAFIGNIFANDIDNDNLNYSFVGENNVFEIDEFTGDIRVINSMALDFEELTENDQPLANLEVHGRETLNPYFELVVKAEDNEGEVVETTAKIYVINVYETFDPEQVNNAFTPGSDDANSTWSVLNVYNYVDCQLRIYNQWQQIVFSMDGYDNSWNGTNIDNDELPAGTYYYIFDCGDESHTGYITIIR